MKRMNQIKSMKAMTKLMFFLVVSQLLFSCGMPKTLKTHLETDDVYWLINDYDLHRKYQPTIQNYLAYTHNYDNESYTQVETYQREARSDSLKKVFQRVLDDKRDHAISRAWSIPKDVNYMLRHYHENLDVAPFIYPVIRQRVEEIISSIDMGRTVDVFSEIHNTEFEKDILPALSNRLTDLLESASYLQTRDLYRKIKGSDLEVAVRPFYSQRREEYLPEVNKQLDEYCKREIAMLNKCKKEGAKGIKEIANDASSSMLNSIMNTYIPNNTKKINSLFNDMNATHNPILRIKEKVKNTLNPLLTKMEMERARAYQDIVGEYIPYEAKVGTVPIKVKRVNVKCPSKTLLAIAQIQGQSSGYETLNDLFGVYDEFDNVGLGIPGVWGMLATAAGWFFGYKAEQAKAERARKLEPKVKALSKSVISGMESACQKEYDNSFNEIKQSIIKSQANFRKEVIANY